MKRLLLGTIIVIVLAGCGILDRGNYEKDRNGFVLRNGYISTYHTNNIGEIDMFQLDQVMSFFEALDYTSFPLESLDRNATISSVVTIQELQDCNIESDIEIPRFLRIDDKTYYYNIRDNGYCTFDEYVFYEEGFEVELGDEISDSSPIAKQNITIFQDADFYVNTFETTIFIETIFFNSSTSKWEKDIVQSLPMSMKQAGSIIEDSSDYFEQVRALEQYVINNQSINLLVLKEGYTDPDINNIWSEETIELLGRDHDLIKNVRFDETNDYLELIRETLRRLGMFS